MKSYIRAGILIVALIAALNVPAQHLWTLDECIEYAVSNNVNIQKGLLEIESREIQLNTSKNSWLPGLNLEFGEQVSFCNYDFYTGHVGETEDESKDLSYTTGRLSMSMPLFNASRLKNTEKSDRYLLEAATENMEKAKKDLGIQISVFFLECLYRKNMVDVARSQVEVSKHLVERSALLVRDGKRPRSEQAEAEAQLANDEYLLTEAEGQAKMSMLALSQLLNMESMDGFDVADIDASQAMKRPDLKSPTAMYEEIVETFPSIMAAKAQIESGKAMVNVARSALYPSLTLNGYIGVFYAKMFHRDIIVDKSTYNFFKDNMNEVIGLHLNIPVFNRFESKNNVHLAKLGVNNMELQLHDARLQLNKEIQTAYYDADVAYDRMIAAEKAVEASSISAAYEEESYEAGRSNLYDLQQVRQKLIQAQQKALQAKYEYLIRLRVLEFYQNN